MTDSKNLPKWASAYVENMKQYRPKTYAECIEAGSLERIALSVQEGAEAAYQQLVQHYMSTGSDESSAQAFAKSDVMRQHICIAPSPDEEDDDEGEVEDWDEMYGGEYEENYDSNDIYISGD